MYEPRLKSISVRFFELNKFSAEYKSSKYFVCLCMAKIYELPVIYLLVRLTIVPHNYLCHWQYFLCKIIVCKTEPSIRVVIRYSNDFGIEVNCEELLKLLSNSLHWSAIFLRTGERTDRTKNKKSSGHLTCSPISSLTLRLKTNLVLLSIVSICNQVNFLLTFL